MALNQHDRSGAERDAGLDRLYLHTGDEVPRSEIDNAIRAAARKAVGARPQALSQMRRWSVPISVAAVIVVSVSVVTLMREKGADRFEDGYVPGRVESKEQPSKAPIGGIAHKAKEIAKPAGQAAIPQAPPATAADVGSAASSEESSSARRFAAPASAPPQPAEARPGELHGQAADRDRNALAPEPAPAHQALGKKTGESEKGALSEPPAPLQSAPARTDQQPPRAQSAMKSERSPVADRVAALIKALDEASPDSWLEKIGLLRREGRSEEADALLSEFKRRYPHHPIPSEETTRSR